MFPTEYYRAIRRNSSLVVYYRLNDKSGNTAIDRAGKYNLNGIYNGLPLSRVPLIYPVNNELGDFYPGSKEFGFAGQNIEIPTSSPIQIVNSITIEAWIWVTASQTCAFVSKKNATYENPSPYFVGLKSGKLYFSVGNGTSKVSITSPLSMPIATPCHIASTMSRSKLSLYINGIKVEQGNLETQEVKDGGKPLFIGENGNNTESFNGLISEVAIYSEALSSRMIKEHFNIGRQIIFNKPYYNSYDEPSYS